MSDVTVDASARLAVAEVFTTAEAPTAVSVAELMRQLQTPLQNGQRMLDILNWGWRGRKLETCPICMDTEMLNAEEGGNAGTLTCCGKEICHGCDMEMQ